MSTLVGKTVAKVRQATAKELEMMGLDYGTEVVEFTDKTILFALRDEEGNGPGVMIFAKGKNQFYVTPGE